MDYIPPALRPVWLWARSVRLCETQSLLSPPSTQDSTQEGKHKQSRAGGSNQVKWSDWSVTSSKSSSSALIGSTAPEECCDWLEQDRREEWLCVSSSSSTIAALVPRGCSFLCASSLALPSSPLLLLLLPTFLCSSSVHMLSSSSSFPCTSLSKSSSSSIISSISISPSSSSSTSDRSSPMLSVRLVSSVSSSSPRPLSLSGGSLAWLSPNSRMVGRFPCLGQRFLRLTRKGCGREKMSTLLPKSIHVTLGKLPGS